MPVILPREFEASWLDPEEQDTAMLSELLLPYDSDRMEGYEVSTLVNSPRNNFPEVIEPVATLF
jgi:putative SOS response-associated peptidase YedK